MKRLFTLLLFATALTWSGCSKDDDDTVDLARLVGTWETTKEYDQEYDEWDSEFGAEFGYISTKEFRADGTCTFREEVVEDQYISEMDFTYVVESNILTITEIDYDYSESARIEKLTASELVLAYDYEGDDGRSYTAKVYLKRVN